MLARAEDVYMFGAVVCSNDPDADAVMEKARILCFILLCKRPMVSCGSVQKVCGLLTERARCLGRALCEVEFPVFSRHICHNIVANICSVPEHTNGLWSYVIYGCISAGLMGVVVLSFTI